MTGADPTRPDEVPGDPVASPVAPEPVVLGPPAPIFPGGPTPEPAAPPFWVTPAQEPPSGGGAARPAPWGPAQPWAPPGHPIAPASGPARSRRTPWIAGGVGAAVFVLGLLAIAVQVWHPWSASGPGTASSSTPGGQGAAPPSAAAGGPGISGPDAASWLAAANAYCRNTTDPALKQAIADSNSDSASYFTRVAAINRQLDTRLRGSVPRALRSDVERVASDWDQMASLYDQAATAARAGDQSKALAYASQAEDANQSGNELALRVGLPDCANAGGIGLDAPSPTSASI